VGPRLKNTVLSISDSCFSLHTLNFFLFFFYPSFFLSFPLTEIHIESLSTVLNDTAPPMTYARPPSDSMMVASTTTTTLQNGNHPDGGTWAGSPDRTEHHQQNGSDEEGGQTTQQQQQQQQTREVTDSPTSHSTSNGASHAVGGSPPICQNCGTSTTPLWRRNELGATLCNACGLFLKLHGRARPMNLKTDTIKSRNRVKSVTQPKKKVLPNAAIPD